jgi:hypothetical protein
MATFSGSIDQISTSLVRVLEEEFKASLRAKLLEVVDEIVSEVATDYAKATVLSVQSYVAADHYGQAVVHLTFNNDKVKFVPPEATIIQQKDGSYKHVQSTEIDDVQVVRT